MKYDGYPAIFNWRACLCPVVVDWQQYREKAFGQVVATQTWRSVRIFGVRVAAWVVT